jgi:hypothetical protein
MVQTTLIRVDKNHNEKALLKSGIIEMIMKENDTINLYEILEFIKNLKGLDNGRPIEN